MLLLMIWWQKSLPKVEPWYQTV
ncbi:hypothetical protein CIB84_008913 [Bambusicola thoracicus]|uniref:Uncharacterized protein n=1 Tax=Bambusicola thoracicus TaxID=9083 RepID=A0A2P4ST91_BAMTH|nr:hypothetical protein CIB84_008913 [Bambusicola thoracicus]